jgi:hypothetical protein
MVTSELPCRSSLAGLRDEQLTRFAHFRGCLPDGVHARAIEGHSPSGESLETPPLRHSPKH